MTSHNSYEQYRIDLERQIDLSIENLRAKLTGDAGFVTAEMPWRRALDDSLSQILNTQNISIDATHPPKTQAVSQGYDYALQMFKYAQVTKVSPAELAIKANQELEKNNVFERVEVAGPYLNMRLKDDVLINNLRKIVAGGMDYGRINDNSGKIAIIDYSSPNVAKPFGINHLRSTVIGESVARILEATGFRVVRDNHLGDWGTQFGNLLAAHHEYASDKDFTSLSMDELTELYVRFNQEKKTSPELEKLGQSFFSKLEAGDEELLEKWTYALNLSINDFSKMYARLNVSFDTMVGEGYYVEASNSLIDKLATLAPADLVVFDASTKAVYINAEHPVVLRTQDGYGVYAARDLATIDFRLKTYNPDAIIYVVGEEQSSYLRSVFEVANKTGLSYKKDSTPAQLEHVGFGLLLDKEGKKLSTRKGTSGKLEDVISALDAHAIEETKKRNPEMEQGQIEDIARKVANGALIWNDLRTDRRSSVKFDIERMLELGGGSITDIFYAYSRSCSILDKLGVKDTDDLESDLPENFSTENEHQLALLLSELSSVIRKSAEERAPHLIVAYLHELSLVHGRFYEESRVAGIDDNNLANLRVALHRSYKIVVQNGLNLLNISPSHRL